MGLAFLVHGTIAGSWATRIPSVKQSLDLSEGALGIALSGAAAGALLAMPLTGALVARLGSRSTTRATLALLCVALVLPVLAPNLPALLFALLLYGAAGGAMDVAMNAQGVAVEAHMGRPVLSSFHGLWSLGGFLGATAGGALVGADVTPAVHLGGVGASLATVGLVGTRSLRVDHEGDSGSPVFVRPTRALALLGAIAFCSMFGEGSALDWSAVYIDEWLDAGGSTAAAGFAAFSLAMGTGRFVGDRIVARVRAPTFLRASATLAAAGLGTALLIGQPLAAIAGFGALGAGVSCIVPVVFGCAGRMPGVDPGPGIAAVATVGYIAFLSGPVVVGTIAELVGLPLALWCVVALVAAITLLAPKIEPGSPNA